MGACLDKGAYGSDSGRMSGPSSPYRGVLSLFRSAVGLSCGPLRCPPPGAEGGFSRRL